MGAAPSCRASRPPLRGSVARQPPSPPTSRLSGPGRDTKIIEGTRSAPDVHGAYDANVTVEGVKKGARANFFPKDWTPERIEKEVMEAYGNRKQNWEYRLKCTLPVGNQTGGGRRDCVDPEQQFG